MNYNINRLEHMIDACEKILKFTDVDYTEYEHSEEKQAAVARYFEILGEAAGKITADLKHMHPNIPWKTAISLRNILIHDYVKVDYEELWRTAKADIAPLLIKIKDCLNIELTAIHSLSDRERNRNMGVGDVLNLSKKRPKGNDYSR